MQKNSGGKWEAYYQQQVTTGKRRSLSALVPLSLTTQVTDQWKFAGQVPEWSDSGTPAQKVTGSTPVINRLVLGLLFSTAIFRTLPILHQCKGKKQMQAPKRARAIWSRWATCVVGFALGMSISCCFLPFPCYPMRTRFLVEYGLVNYMGIPEKEQ